MDLREPLLYLSAGEVEALLPTLEERIALAEAAMVALVSSAQLPPKIGVHPRSPDSFGHAMPAWLGGASPDGAEDLLGMKWVVGFPTNRKRGVPKIHALALLNDPTTGVPTAILDAGPITAHRTAAVSGVAIRAFGPRLNGRQPVAVIVGAGVQGQSHLPVLGHLLPGVALRIHDRHPDRSERLAAEAAATPGIGTAVTASDPRAATQDADVVVTAVSFGPVTQWMTTGWFSPNALVVPVDYDTCVAADVARSARRFLVDDRGQFLSARAAGRFSGYPDPGWTFGEALPSARGKDDESRGGAADGPAGRWAPEGGRTAEGRLTLATHLGVGLADIIFGDAILRRARAQGAGTVLPR